MAVRVRFVSVQTAVTDTPGSTAPVVSMTVPPMSPVVRWASAGTALVRVTQNSREVLHGARIMSAPRFSDENV
jgi:hypothetical protein